MGPRIEHAAVVGFVLLGQFIGHFLLRRANGLWHFIPDKSVWVPVVGIALGLVAYFVILWVIVGVILLAGKCGINVPSLKTIPKNSTSAGKSAGVALVSGPRTVTVVLS